MITHFDIGTSQTVAEVKDWKKMKPMTSHGIKVIGESTVKVRHSGRFKLVVFNVKNEPLFGFVQFKAKIDEVKLDTPRKCNEWECENKSSLCNGFASTRWVLSGYLDLFNGNSSLIGNYKMVIYIKLEVCLATDAKLLM